MCLIIVLTDHTNSDVLHFLIGLSEEVLLFELLHHGWDSYRDHNSNDNQTNDNHMTTMGENLESANTPFMTA